MRTFRDFTATKAQQITFMGSEFYPDALAPAVVIYKPILEQFGRLIRTSTDSTHLFRQIIGDRNAEQRRQLLRVFKKYVCPDVPVEMSKKLTNAEMIVTQFGSRFRDLAMVKAAYDSRPVADEAIIAVLNEHGNRGQKGYDLTGAFFQWFEDKFGPKFEITGPKGAGKDINLATALPGYDKEKRPVDALIREKNEPLVVGLARYDSDRGGAQEDDRTGGYGNAVNEILAYAQKASLPRLKVLFLNDGPGLLCGSMWTDYCSLEESFPGRVMVCTLRMLNERLTEDWIRS